MWNVIKIDASHSPSTHVTFKTELQLARGNYAFLLCAPQVSGILDHTELYSKIRILPV